MYKQWTVRKKTAVYDNLKHKRRIAYLSVGDKVTGVSGVVITVKPGIIRMDRDLPGQSLKRGETILTYAYRGEGTSAVWLRDAYCSDFDISFTRWPDGSGCGGEYCAATYVDLGVKVWWAKVKLKLGRIGWVNMDHANFDMM